MRKMLRGTVVAGCAVVGVAGTVVAAPGARADDFYVDESFTIRSIRADHTRVVVRGLATTPVTITMTTQDVPGQTNSNRSGFMTLTESPYATSGVHIPLALVSRRGAVATWRGVYRPTGPSQRIMIGGVGNCLLRRPGTCDLPAGGYRYPSFASGPTITVTAVATPRLVVDRAPTLPLATRTYVVRGRVVNSATKGAYGRALTVAYGLGTECDTPAGGRRVTTGRDGRFAVRVNNTAPTRATHGVLPLAANQCVRLVSTARDTAGDPVVLAEAAVERPWRHTLLASAPAVVPKATSTYATVRSSVPVDGDLTVERKVGNRWASQGGQWGWPFRLQHVWFRPEEGRHTYRVRNGAGQAVSAPFVVTVR